MAKKQRVSLATAIQAGDSVKNMPPKATLPASSGAFNYNLIEDADTRNFLGRQANEIRELMLDSHRLYQKAETILDQSTQALVEAGKAFQVVKDRLREANGHGHWVDWLRDEFSQTFVEVGVLTQSDSLDPKTIERKAQELMQIARTIEEEPEHRELMKLSVKPYLLGRLTAPSTPIEARVEVVEQIREAETKQKKLPGTKEVRHTIAKHNPKPSDTRNRIARSISAAPPEPPKPEIVAVIPAPEVVEATIEESPAPAKTKVKPQYLYCFGKHVLFTGSPADPRWLISLPRNVDADGKVFFELLTDYSSNEPVVVELRGQVFAACEDLELVAGIIDEWEAATGQQVIPTPAFRQ